MSPHSPRPTSLDWLDALLQPRLALSWTLPEWDRVVRLSRRMRLLACLGEALQAHDLIDGVPAAAQRHLRAQMQVSRWRTGTLYWAALRIVDAVGEAPGPLVLLKGAAYLAQGLPISLGRLPSDLDILVPEQGLEAARQRLMTVGWTATATDDHDRRYYEEWSHEVPPMVHPVHPVELDLHHNILPPVAAVSVDAGQLLTRLRPSTWSTWQVLQPEDQVLHSAAHLFYDSEFSDRVRDIVDLDGLLRHFGSQAGFADSLLARAQELGLTEPLALAVHFARSWLHTPVDPAWARKVERYGPRPARSAWLVPLYQAALEPPEADASARLAQRIAATALLARYHWNRLPLPLLLPHLWHKWRKDPTANRVAPEPGA